ISILLSCLVTCFLQANASVVATVILGDIRCEPLLMAMSYSFPFAAIHSCICGYYFGFKQTGIPASSQLIEQLLRVATVYGLYLFAIHHSLKLNITIAVLGLVFGEIASAAFCMQAFTAQHKKTDREKNSFRTCFFQLKTLLPLSIPLTANRILLNLLQSVEAISIPARLQLYGLTSSEALSMYGVLTGMALPCILFPSAITNSVSTMMLPTVAEIQAADHPLRLIALIKKVTGCCFLLGTGCCLFFLFAGHFMGKVLFQSPLAGQFIFILAFICPFQYTNSTLLSILNGLGKTSSSFGITSIGLLLRILSVFFLIPMVGILGYLWGLLASQLVVSVLCLGSLKHHLSGVR
ncbi:MAG: polysaccharide biosynthesis C-terminal domain-containing protein, partial [Lachnospiraceae bacterium]